MGKTIEIFGFPSGVVEEEVRSFVEEITGTATISMIKTKRAKGRGRRIYAIIQFNAEKDAELIISLANQELLFGDSYLKVQTLEDDNDMTFKQTFKGLTLHFGSQISENKFLSFHQVLNVSVDFSFGRKLLFSISQYRTRYMLVLSYENIWRVELHRPRALSAEYLLIQVVGAPRIYERLPGLGVGDPFMEFSKYIDDVWVRSTDFTPSSSIGQSSSLCLESPISLRLPNLHKRFAYYKENRSKFVLDKGPTYSCDNTLVPMVRPPRGSNSSYEILFKINLLVQHGCLPGPSLDESFYKRVDPQKEDVSFIEHALKKLYHLKECCYDPSKWLMEEYRDYRKSKNPPRSSVMSLNEGLVYVHRVQVTPCRVYFNGPEVNVSNRVIRNYPEYINNFLRVSFVDEELEKMYSTNLSPRSSSENKDRRTKIYDRILSILENGIVIGDKRFEFLAFSSSQLRENSTWMFASREGLTAADIRKWMGNFNHIRNVAKYAARLGQSFGSSTETLSVPRHEVEVIPEIEVKSDEFRYVFSDGIGKISADFAKKVAVKCGIKNTPSAFQIRYGGYKGVVSIDPHSRKKLSLRKSMLKYDSENTKLDVLFWSRFQPCFLNRQLITLLSTLGVEDHVFELKQRLVVDHLDTILTDPLKAQEVLEWMSPGENTNVLKAMLQCGYEPKNEPFLSMMLSMFRASKLLDLRRKSRIFIPNGRAMIGCLDETRKLKYGQVFVQFSMCGKTQFYDHSVIRRGTRDRFIVEGRVVVAKNPCLHPGDIRVLQAINVPALHHMVDCVVFPQQGQRPHPNECSGSDLDGDIYFVSWDPDLIPPRQVEPMDYTPPPSKVLDHDVTMKEVQEYFANYMVNDSLGIIANAHTVFADKDPEKAMSSSCIELAKLFSIAVDFPKTGVPAIIPRHLFVKEYPDFMGKNDRETYESMSVIGKLFRELVEMEPEEINIQPFTMRSASLFYDPEMEVQGFEDYLDDAFYHKTNYDRRLGNLMDSYGIEMEAEILTASETAKSISFTKRDIESVINSIRSLRKEARNWFNDTASNRQSFRCENLYAKASAWYFVTYHPSYWGCYNEGKNHDHFLSFPWCVYDKLVRIKTRKFKSIGRRNKRVSGR